MATLTTLVCDGCAAGYPETPMRNVASRLELLRRPAAVAGWAYKRGHDFCPVCRADGKAEQALQAHSRRVHGGKVRSRRPT